MKKTMGMLGTIKLPTNMKNIHENLPRSNYETDKQKEKARRQKEQMTPVVKQ